MTPSMTAEWDLEAAEEPDATGDSEPEVYLGAVSVTNVATARLQCRGGS